MAKLLTEKDVAKEKCPEGKREVYLTDHAPRNAGRLVLRVSPTVKTWIYRYTTAAGLRRSLVIGEYPAVGLAVARGVVDGYRRERAADRANADDVREHEADKRRAVERARAEAVRRERDTLESRELAEKYTLEKLCDAYVADLKKRGKVRVAADAKSAFAKNITKAAPAVAATPARAVTETQITSLMRSLIDAGKNRMAQVLRSYLSAAFNLAMRAPRDPNAAEGLVEFRIVSNPVQLVQSETPRIRDRVLSPAELRQFIEVLRARKGAKVDAVLLSLLLGGQRPQQIIRATAYDYDRHEMRLTLRDPKGRRKNPRLHVLPLSGEAARIVDRCADAVESIVAAAIGDEPNPRYMFSTNGRAPVRIDSVSAAVSEIAQKISGVAAPAFTWRDVRRTAETMMAELGISKDTRALLLSHGLAGVQHQRYDRSESGAILSPILDSWEKHLARIESGEVEREQAAAKSARVIAMRQKRSA